MPINDLRALENEKTVQLVIRYSNTKKREQQPKMRIYVAIIEC